jgi:hypothetical protein
VYLTWKTSTALQPQQTTPHSGSSVDADVFLSTMSIFVALPPCGYLRAFSCPNALRLLEGIYPALIQGQRSRRNRPIGRSATSADAADDQIGKTTRIPGNGGAYRDRTDDLLNANQALSQLS